MRVDYDVAVPRKCTEDKQYAPTFWEFYNSDHDNARLGFSDTNTAVKCQKAMCMLLSRNRIFDVKVTRRKNTVYLIRGDVNA